MQARPHDEHEVSVAVGAAMLGGTLTVPQGGAPAVVVFAHGSGSSRFSTRNRMVAKRLNDYGFATLLFDLLTQEEERIDAVTGHLRFNIEFLSNRLLGASAWVFQHTATRKMHVGYFGASTGAAAALVAAAQLPRAVQAVVSRGGRPDLAGESLSQVQAPTLLIVGANDVPVIEMNKTAMQQMNCVSELAIVPAATHLFEEPGALDAVAELAADWFEQYLLPRKKKVSTAS